MKKYLTGIACILLSIFLCTGCFRPRNVLPDTAHTATGRVGDKMMATYFSFVVDSADVAYVFAGYEPLRNEKYIDVVISVYNPSSTEVVLQDSSFQLRWGESGFADPQVAFTDTMAPAETTLAPGASAQYHYLYSVPVSTTDFSICYLDECYTPTGTSVSNLFYVPFSI